jgi:hypothetical protein
VEPGAALRESAALGSAAAGGGTGGALSCAGSLGAGLPLVAAGAGDDPVLSSEKMIASSTATPITIPSQMRSALRRSGGGGTLITEGKRGAAAVSLALGNAAEPAPLSAGMAS